MRKADQEIYENIAKTCGFTSHPGNKKLWTAVIYDKQYGIKMEGTEPSIFIIDENMNHVQDLTDPVLKKMVSLTMNKKVPDTNPFNDEPAPEPKPPEKKSEIPPESEQPPASENKGTDNTAAPEDKKWEDVPDEDPAGPGESEQEIVDDGEPEYVDAEYVDIPDDDNSTAQQVDKSTSMPVVQHNRPVKKEVQHRIRGLDHTMGECGKIKIGRKGAVRESGRGNKFRMPEKLEYFLVTTTAKNDEDDFIIDEEVMQKLGDKPTRIPVRLPYNDPVLNFPTRYAYYDSARCVCSGDGLYAKDATGEIIDCNPKECPWALKGKCKANGTLSVILEDKPTVGGVYKFRTTSWNSLSNIMAAMEFIQRVTGGILAGLPLDLVLAPKTVNIPGGKGTTVIYMVNLEFRGYISDLTDIAKAEAQLRAGYLQEIKKIESAARLQLDAPQSAEECMDIACEFYPQTVKEDIRAGKI